MEMRRKSGLGEFMENVTGKKGHAWRTMHPVGQVILAAASTLFFLFCCLVISFTMVYSSDRSKPSMYQSKAWDIGTIFFVVVYSIPSLIALWLLVKKNNWASLGIIIGLAMPFFLVALCSIVLG